MPESVGPTPINIDYGNFVYFDTTKLVSFASKVDRVGIGVCLEVMLLLWPTRHLDALNLLRVAALEIHQKVGRHHLHNHIDMPTEGDIFPRSNDILLVLHLLSTNFTDLNSHTVPTSLSAGPANPVSIAVVLRFNPKPLLKNSVHHRSLTCSGFAYKGLPILGSISRLSVPKDVVSRGTNGKRRSSDLYLLSSRYAPLGALDTSAEAAKLGVQSLGSRDSKFFLAQNIFSW